MSSRRWRALAALSFLSALSALSALSVLPASAQQLPRTWQEEQNFRKCGDSCSAAESGARERRCRRGELEDLVQGPILEQAIDECAMEHIACTGGVDDVDGEGRRNEPF